MDCSQRIRARTKDLNFSELCVSTHTSEPVIKAGDKVLFCRGTGGSVADGCSFNIDICCTVEGSTQTAQVCTVSYRAGKDHEKQLRGFPVYI